MIITRPPAVAGTFYPANARELAATVHAMLVAAGDGRHAAPKAIIVPHAGYVYSGPVAASAFARLAPLKGRIERVVLLGPCHRVAVSGAALCSADAFETPLGAIPVDHTLDAALLGLGGVQVFDATHEDEHSLEVQLPFLQQVLGDFQLLPLVVGDMDAHGVADVLDVVWGGTETLIVISSDLTHYLDYTTAQRIDAQTAKAIESLSADAIANDDACGRVPVKGLLVAAKRHGLSVETLDLRNSGDTAGPRDRVVGYGAWAFIDGAG